MEANTAANLRKAQQHRKRAKEHEDKARDQNELADAALAAALNHKPEPPIPVSDQVPQSIKGAPPKSLNPFDRRTR